VIAISCQVSSFSVKLHFNELMIELDFYSANSLKQQFTGRHVAPLWYIILIQNLPVFTLTL